MAEQSIADYLQQNLAPKEQKINDFLSSAAKTVASPAPKTVQQQTPTIQNAPSPTGQPIGIPQPQMLDENGAASQGIRDYVNQFMAATGDRSGMKNEDITNIAQNYLEKTYGANIAKDQTAYSASVDLAKQAIGKQMDLWKEQQSENVVKNMNPAQDDVQQKFGTMSKLMDAVQNQWGKTQDEVIANKLIPYGGFARSHLWLGTGDGWLAKNTVPAINSYETLKDGFSRALATAQNVTPGADSKPAVAESIHQMLPGAQDNNISGSMKLYNAYSMLIQEAMEHKIALDNSHVNSKGWLDIVNNLKQGRQSLEDKYLDVWKGARLAPWADSGDQSAQSNQSGAKPSSLPIPTSGSGLSTQTQQLIRQQAQQGVAPNGQ